MVRPIDASFDRSAAVTPFGFQFGGGSSKAAAAVRKNDGHVEKGAMKKAGADGKKEHEVAVLPSSSSPTIWSVYLDYIKAVKGLKNGVLKMVYIPAEWFYTFTGVKEAKQITVLGKQCKNIASSAEIPEAGIELVQAAAKLQKDTSASAFVSLANKAGRLAIPVIEVARVVCDTVKPMTSATAKVVNTVFNSALTFTTTYSTVEELQKIGAEKAKKLPTTAALRDRVIALRDAQLTQSQLKIATSTSYGAIGVLGLASAFAGTAVAAPWVILSLATSGVTFTLLTHFQKKLHLEPAQASLHARVAASAA